LFGFVILKQVKVFSIFWFT